MPPLPEAETAPRINQGDLYWLQLETEIPHPYVVVQDDVFNHSRVQTVIVCALTTNVKKIESPGNILLDVDEAGLPKQSVIEISKLSTVAKSQLTDYIGTLSAERVQAILDGLRFMHLSFFTR